MTTSTDPGKRELEWMAPAAPHQPFVLSAHGERLGWLLFEDEDGRRAQGELDGRRWTFERAGLAHPHVIIRAEDVVGEFSGHVVSFATGARYRWSHTSFWGDTWCFHREGDKTSVCVTQQSGPIQTGGKVSLCCGGGPQPETPILVLLAWYLRVLDYGKLIAEANARLPVF